MSTVGETTRGKTFTGSLSSQGRLYERRKRGDSDHQTKLISLRKERRSSGRREGENMRTAFQDLEKNGKTKKNIIFFVLCKCTRIHSHETPERELG